MTHFWRTTFFCVFVVFLVFGFSGPVIAQRLNFITSTPILDSFPIVKVKFTASYNGKAPAPPLNPTNFVVREDNTVVPAEIVGCDGIPTSAVVFCSDASTSMVSSAGNTQEVYDVFYRCFGSCFSILPAGSRYSLITFYDHNIDDYPGTGHVNGFYDVGTKVDSINFANTLKALPYAGATYVNEALEKAITLLRYQPFASKAIVLVTDDAAYDLPHLDSLMKEYNITLYVMEVGSDISTNNIELSHLTGGTYFQAIDSTSYEPVMSQIGELIGSEHCFLRYKTPNDCPWYASHSIDMSLTYNGLTRIATGTYNLFRNFLDSTGPNITTTTPIYISRLVTISEQFPCQRGLYSATDSIRENISLRTRRRTFAHYFPKVGGKYVDSNYFSMHDSLVVIDSMFDARAVYAATDSAGNRSVSEITYKPKPDQLPPVLNTAFSNGGKYTIAATEARPWDRGLTQIRLAPGAINVIFDSARIFNRRAANAWLRIIDTKLDAHACIEAEDSVGNIGTFCIDKTIAGPVPTDTIAPVILQDPIVFPKPGIAAKVTDAKLLDKGIKTITIEPAANILPPVVTYASAKSATISIAIIDTLQPVRAWITAADTAGNVSTDTLRYDPLPDNTSPVCTIDAPSSTTRLFHSTEFASWDRGITSITILGTPQNIIPGPVSFITKWQADQLFTIIDPTLPGSVVVKAIDSAGHECLSNISFDGAPKPLVPLQVQTRIDYLTHQAPFDSTATIEIVNPNEVPIIITKLTTSGDTEFTSTLLTPLVFQPFEKHLMEIRFTTPLLGSWNGAFGLANDTMPLAHITTIAKTVGTAQLFIGSVTAPYSQTRETLELKLKTDPLPINLDTIAFDLVFDGDLISPDLTKITSTLTNYLLQPTSTSEGRIHVVLSRSDRSQLVAIDTAVTSIFLPFTTYISRNATSPVRAENFYVGAYATLTSDTGSISIENQCGDETLRALLNDNLDAYIKGITPNPAAANFTVTVQSKETGAPVTISLVDQLGVIVIRKHLTTQIGANILQMDCSDIAAGNYIVILHTPHSPTSLLPLKIVR